MLQDQASRLRSLIKGDTDERSAGGKNLRIIAVGSGKGGVGKTNFSLNLAVALTRLGKRVVVFDGDLGLANVDVICGLAPSFTLEDVLAGRKTVAEVVVDGPQGIKILPGGTGSNLVDLAPRAIENLLDKLRYLEEIADILLIDTGAGIARSVIQLLGTADEVIVVATPEPTSLTDAYGLIKTLISNNSLCRIGVLVNRVHSTEEAESTYTRLATVAQRFLSIKLNYLGYVFEDRFLAKSVMRQSPVTVAFPAAPASTCINYVAQNLLGIMAKAPAKAGGIRVLMEGLIAHLYTRG